MTLKDVIDLLFLTIAVLQLPFLDDKAVLPLWHAFVACFDSAESQTSSLVWTSSPH